MKRFALIMVSMALMPCALSASLPDPIAEAASGKLQCYAPDKARKTCSSLAGYRKLPDGRIINTALVLISGNLTMETKSPVEIKSGQVCGTLRERDVDEAKFASAGQTLDAQRSAAIRQSVKGAYKAFFDHEICTKYFPDADGLIAKATMDGVAMPSGDQRVIWVSPSDGYKVSP